MKAKDGIILGESIYSTNRGDGAAVMAQGPVHAIRAM